MSSRKKTLLAAMLLCSAFACYGGERFRDRHDESRGRVWQLTRSGVVVHDVGRTVRVPLPDWTFAGPRYGCLPDLALGPKGEALISSDVMPVLWRVDPQTLAVTRHELALDADRDKDVGFFNLAWDARRGAWLAVSTVDGGFWQIDAQLKTARKLSAVLWLSCRGSSAAAGASRERTRSARLW